MQKTAIIIGAGPAGLTAAYELLEQTDIKPVVFELSGQVGGISKTINYKGNRIDIGGHRFFSKSERVMEWWQKILPLETEAREDNIMLVRNRISRIYFLKKFFNYPIKLDYPTLAKLGPARVFKIAVSYIRIRLKPIKEEKTLEDFFINRFGRELYITFFKDYTKKVWGRSCREIKPEWGAQRIKGLSVSKAILHSLKGAIKKKSSSIEQKNTETSLIDKFIYPKYGPGQLWEKAAGRILKKGGEINLGRRIVGIINTDDKITGVQVKNLNTGEIKKIECDYLISTMPIKELIGSLKIPAPDKIRDYADKLIYRDFITVGILIKNLKSRNGIEQNAQNLIPDNWLYIQEKEVGLGRIQIFNNWSPYMVKDKNNVWLGLEYFCFEGDNLWRKSDSDMIDLATDELARIGITEKGEPIIDGTVIRMKKAYPAYFGGGYDNFKIIREFTDSFSNLFLIGRNGMHRYNNQDHSMLTAMAAVENIKNKITAKDNIWNINAEKEYHEKITSVENLTRGLLKNLPRDNYSYNPDIYWENTEISYPHYPTVRHRKRFIQNKIDKLLNGRSKDDVFIFDYGCGEGSLLRSIGNKFSLNDNQLGGSDISERAVKISKEKIKSPYFYNEVFPVLPKKCDIIICSEVIEHTKDYPQILHWIKNNLKQGGQLILTTQAGKIHASDRYTGHTQHFKMHVLKIIMEKLGYEISYAKSWGFPFFTLQKYLTNINFENIQKEYLEKNLTIKNKIVFGLAYGLYFLHDHIPAGPQIYITAKRK